MMLNLIRRRFSRAAPEPVARRRRHHVEDGEEGEARGRRRQRVGIFPDPDRQRMSTRPASEALSGG
jgi:hypothetical protein